jgi:predicted class III extradiol MEMO1 family dioxygenase
MKRSGIPISQLTELSSDLNHFDFMNRWTRKSRNRLDNIQKEKLEDINHQLDLMRRLMSGEDIDESESQ